MFTISTLTEGIGTEVFLSRTIPPMVIDSAAATMGRRDMRRVSKTWQRFMSPRVFEQAV
jgi:hypothetical protein